MPTGEFMNRSNLLPAVQDGRVKQQVIDEKVGHILQTAVRLGWLDREQADLSLSKYDKRDHEIALQAARESIVLLKNDRQLLPPDKRGVKSILVVGPDASIHPSPLPAGAERLLPSLQSRSSKTFRALRSAVICASRSPIGGNS
jgi:beta-glucosidase-like glycosyl hydrolase